MITSLIVIAFMFMASFFFITLLLGGKKYDGLLEPIDGKEFPLKEIYGVGFKLMTLFNIDLRSSKATRLRQEAVILYGDRYAEYYLRILYAQRFSISFLVIVAASIFACFAQAGDQIFVLGLGVMVSVALFYHFQSSSSKKIKKRSILFLGEFPKAVATIALLVNSGMMLREAWAEVAKSDNKELHLQMQTVTTDIENGVSEKDALYAFALRCATPEIKKFTSLIIQGLEKGSQDLAHALKNQSEELWEVKKQNVLTQGELASSKLLIPIMIMFIGVLIMIMVPIMTNLGI